MNKDRILELANLIESQPHTKRGSRYGFSMSNWHHTCGTPSCIAGWAVALSRGEESGRNKIPLGASSIASLFLGIDDAQEINLFCPPLEDWSGITPQEAAKTLRILAETGKVDWSHVTKS